MNRHHFFNRRARITLGAASFLTAALTVAAIFGIRAAGRDLGAAHATQPIGVEAALSAARGRVFAVREKVIAAPSRLPSDIVTRDGAVTSEYQQRLIEDRQLTFAEYRSAHEAWAECMNVAGVGLEPIGDANGLGRLHQRFKLSDHIGVREAFESAKPACDANFISLVDLAWAAATAELMGVAIDESRDWMAACVAGSGVTPDFNPFEDATAEQTAAFMKCSGAWSDATDIPVGFGMTGDGARRVKR